MLYWKKVPQLIKRGDKDTKEYLKLKIFISEKIDKKPKTSEAIEIKDNMGCVMIF